MPFGVLSGVSDVMINAKFYVNRLRCFSTAAPRKVPFPMLFRRPLQLFCTTVQTVTRVSIYVPVHLDVMIVYYRLCRMTLTHPAVARSLCDSWAAFQLWRIIRSLVSMSMTCHARSVPVCSQRHTRNSEKTSRQVRFVCGWQVKLCDPNVTHGPHLSALEITNLYISN